MAPPRHRACTEQLTSKVFFVYYQSVINFSASEILLQAPNGPKVTCLVPNSHRMHIAAPKTHRTHYWMWPRCTEAHDQTPTELAEVFSVFSALSAWPGSHIYTTHKFFSVLNFIYLASNTNNKAKQFKGNFLRSFRYFDVTFIYLVLKKFHSMSYPIFSVPKHIIKNTKK